MLELGSGTGLVGLVAGYLGACVCITDQAYVIFTLYPRIVASDPEVANRHFHILLLSFSSLPADNKRPLIPIMERNILLNRLQSNVTASELDWCVCLPYLKVLAPRFTWAHTGFLLQFYKHRSSGQKLFPHVSNPRTLSSQPTAYTWKPRSRYSSPPWSRSSHHPRGVRPRFCSLTRSAEKPTNASSLCSKHISHGHLWYAVFRIN